MSRAACSRRISYGEVAEYDLVCDSCSQTCDPLDAVVTWKVEGASESGFALTHAAHAPTSGPSRIEVRRLIWPNEFLAFVNARLGKRIADPEPPPAIVATLAPLLIRPHNDA